MIWVIAALVVLITIFMIFAFSVEFNENKDESEFERWAFGTEVSLHVKQGTAGRMQLMNAWNELHGHELKLKPHDTLKDSEKRMREIWKKSKGPK